MFTAYLLRFQEFCDDCLPDVRAGTATSTRIRSEQPDTDVSIRGLSAISRSVDAAGTMTKTSIDRESGGVDADRAESQMRAVPVAATGTATRTKVKHEQADIDGLAAGRAVPLPLPIAQTKTVTAVRAEADDLDPRRTSLNAIPRCS